MFNPFFSCSKLFLNYLIFKSFVFQSTWWRLFKRRVVHTKDPFTQSKFSVKVFWQKICAKKTLSKIIQFSQSMFDQSFYPKLPFSSKFKDKQNSWIRSWFQRDVLIGQFPLKSVKVFRKIGWVSIPSKFFDKENLDQVFDGKLWSCKRKFDIYVLWHLCQFLYVLHIDSKLTLGMQE